MQEEEPNLRPILNRLPVPPACLIKTELFGALEEGDEAFDHEDVVTETLMSAHQPIEFNVCI